MIRRFKPSDWSEPQWREFSSLLETRAAKRRAWCVWSSVYDSLKWTTVHHKKSTLEFWIGVSTGPNCVENSSLNFCCGPYGYGAPIPVSLLAALIRPLQYTSNNPRSRIRSQETCHWQPSKLLGVCESLTQTDVTTVVKTHSHIHPSRIGFSALATFSHRDLLRPTQPCLALLCISLKPNSLWPSDTDFARNRKPNKNPTPDADCGPVLYYIYPDDAVTCIHDCCKQSSGPLIE